jgi:hypothetical protein
VTVVYNYIPPQKVWVCAGVVTLRRSRMSVDSTEGKLESHFVNTAALVLESACRYQTPAWTRSTCCCPGDAVLKDSCCLHAERGRVLVLGGAVGYIVVGSGLGKVGASGAGQRLEEGGHDRGGLEICDQYSNLKR